LDQGARLTTAVLAHLVVPGAAARRSRTRRSCGSTTAGPMARGRHYSEFAGRRLSACARIRCRPPPAWGTSRWVV